ncbi:MAG TPA: FAD-binding protein [Thermoplasmatales archaeon]|nr:FAD-binding protein [Thermoplasmatales archaeon]
MKTDVVVIGGGPAGLAAALKASERVEVMLLERGEELGGILPQCIHHGFGNFIFQKMLTGPEYAQHYVDLVKQSSIDVRTETMVLSLDGNCRIMATNPREGLVEIEAKAVVLAMGCRERTRNQILLPGTRPAGIYTAGTAQRLINMDGLMPGKRVVILGSGDVGLIMARRFTLEGAEVEGVYELMPFPGGLTRNVVQCLHDYDIPLHLSHTVVDIRGQRRLEGVVVARVDESFTPVAGTERFIPCDCLILAVGLIPENELTRGCGIEMDGRTGGPVVDECMETSVSGIFACGNVVHVHDVVDDVSLSAERAGMCAARHAEGNGEKVRKNIPLLPGENVRYVVPQRLSGAESMPITLYLRVMDAAENVNITVSSGGALIVEKKERVVRPPEMVKVELPAESVKNIAGEVRVDVRK